MAYALTPKQLRLKRFIAGYVEAKGRAPTLCEIAAGMGLSNRSRAHDLNSQLCERGHLATRRHEHRSARLLSPIAIPRAPDGAPLFVVPGFGIGGE